MAFSNLHPRGGFVMLLATLGYVARQFDLLDWLFGGRWG